MIALFGTKLPQITKWELKEKLLNLDQGSKTTLYWFYSEFLLRANRNPWYKQVLNHGTITAIDGKGLHWSMYMIIKGSLLADIYGQKIVFLPLLIRAPIFLIMFIISLIANLIKGVWDLVIAKTNFNPVTKNETILGRDFTYDILKICKAKNYKTLIIGGSNEDDSASKALIQKMYPGLNILLWTRKTNSLLMRDLPLAYDALKTGNKQGRIVGEPKPFLTTANLYKRFPDLLEAKAYIKEEKPDVILTCIGGGSGKQEFFIHDLKTDPEISFTMATGLGAAIDHLGGGKEQTLPPKWMQQTGLEWLFRFFDQPYRRMRIIDSIFSLYWWTTLNLYTNAIDPKASKANYSLNIVYDNANKVINYTPKSFLPGDLGPKLLEYPIANNQTIEESAINQFYSLFGIKLKTHFFIKTPEKGRNVTLPVSLLGFAKNGFKTTKKQYYTNYIHIDQSLTVSNHYLRPQNSILFFSTTAGEVLETTLNPDCIMYFGRPNYLKP
jgi:UDP-N-acetyl-D-mannosaminuronic acid transferase (WecB/TagA/CpsF family)